MSEAGVIAKTRKFIAFDGPVPSTLSDLTISELSNTVEAMKDFEARTEILDHTIAHVYMLGDGIYPQTKHFIIPVGGGDQDLRNLSKHEM